MLVLAAGCGQKGPLTLPPPAAKAPVSTGAAGSTNLPTSAASAPSK
jgi:predicted small lipoprotein YifL